MDYNNNFNQVMIYQTFCLVPKSRSASISFHELVLIVDARYDNSRLGYRAQDKQLTSYEYYDSIFCSLYREILSSLPSFKSLFS
jgi:hypothetical protein